MNTQFEGLLAAAHARDTLSAAGILVGNGLPVFPCLPTKAPYTPHGFKDASSDPDVIAGWWDQWPNALIGLPTGITSGLVVVDVDVKHGRNGFLALRDRDLGCTFATETPSGGMHFFYRHPGAVVKNSTSKLADGVDVRGDGGYVIFPPSITGDGCYSLAIPSQVSELQGWVTDTERIEAIDMASILSNNSNISNLSVVSVLSVADVIEKTLPRAVGQRQTCIMNLARGLKYDAGLHGQSLDALRPHVQEWHHRALPVIGTKQFLDTWDDFVRAWERARVPLTGDHIQNAIDCVKGHPVWTPGWIDDDATRLLFAVISRMSELNEGVFWFAVRDIESYIGIDAQTAWRRLNTFESEGYIKRIKKGSQGLATRYRWTGKAPLPGTSSAPQISGSSEGVQS